MSEEVTACSTARETLGCELSAEVLRSSYLDLPMRNR
jgi:hypothetical protein